MNSNLKQLDSYHTRQKLLQKELSDIQEAIKKEFVPCAVLFVDMVDSTILKEKYSESPEKWIYIVHTFYKSIADAVKRNNGEVVKYIGDEVMAAFYGEDAVKNAEKFIEAIYIFLDNDNDILGERIQVKVSADYGDVYPFDMGKETFDILGRPIDRCSRISKLCEPNTVLASDSFALRCKTIGTSLGIVEFNGIGQTSIYQFGGPPIDLPSSKGNFHVLKAAANVCDLISELNGLRAKPDMAAQWVYYRKCLVHEFYIHDDNTKYTLTIDVYMDGEPIYIVLFSRDKKSTKYLMEKVKPYINNLIGAYSFLTWHTDRVILGTFHNTDIKAIAIQLKNTIDLISRYKDQVENSRR